MLNPKIKALSDVALSKLKIFEFLDMAKSTSSDQLQIAKLEMINANYKLIEAINKIAKGTNNIESWPEWKRDYKLTKYS